ncbi:SufD family Fe-S cluster assembly protein [Erysipelothrix urinaevulpis]|uniref:SufB/SufD family protein n=1 Tax=Erysipelothrix urinaevulpis TaxID=2683717 RepID=UPI001358219B|nr:SufD family Fe-S cluster assembly protein [Erysipelothrix urinaevulpis]
MSKISFTSGSHKHLIESTTDTTFTLEFNDKSSGSLFLEIDGEGTLDLIYDLGAYGNWSILVMNRSSKSLTITEDIRLHEFSKLSMNYGELSYGSHIKNTVANFLGHDSELDLNSAILSFDSIKWSIMANHLAKRSKANVNNQAIVLKNAHLDLDIIGKIENGNSGSETHQMTRIMNLGDGLKTIVHPQLLIEENDVAASHAASVGQANEEHIYYLQSRGLTRQESLKLIVLGYLMPIVHLIPEQESKDTLEKEIESKVMEAWTI